MKRREVEEKVKALQQANLSNGEGEEEKLLSSKTKPYKPRAKRDEPVIIIPEDCYVDDSESEQEDDYGAQSSEGEEEEELEKKKKEKKNSSTSSTKSKTKLDQPDLVELLKGLAEEQARIKEELEKKKKEKEKKKPEKEKRAQEMYEKLKLLEEDYNVRKQKKNSIGFGIEASRQKLMNALSI